MVLRSSHTVRTQLQNPIWVFLPALLIILALLALGRAGTGCSRCSSRSISPSFCRSEFPSLDVAFVQFHESSGKSSGREACDLSERARGDIFSAFLLVFGDGTDPCLSGGDEEAFAHGRPMNPAVASIELKLAQG
jgi:hypothetical protein